MLSYAGSDLSPLKRKLVTLIESVLGGAALRRILLRFQAQLPEPERFFEHASDALRLTSDVRFFDNASIPEKGPLLIVANHPYGIIDGLAIGACVETVRSDLRIIVWDAINVPVPEQHFLALDLTEESFGALRQNVKVRRDAAAHLCAGGSILLFPSGSAERSPTPWGQPAEQPWTPLAGKLAKDSEATVLPVRVYGHNSRLFHAASFLGDTIRRALFLRETCLRQESSVSFTVLPALAPSKVAELGSAAQVATYLQHTVLSLEEETEDATVVVDQQEPELETRVEAW